MISRVISKFRLLVLVIYMLCFVIYTVSGKLGFSQAHDFLENDSVVEGLRFVTLNGAISQYSLPFPVSTTLKSTHNILTKGGKYQC